MSTLSPSLLALAWEPYPWIRPHDNGSMSAQIDQVQMDSLLFIAFAIHVLSNSFDMIS